LLVILDATPATTGLVAVAAGIALGLLAVSLASAWEPMLHMSLAVLGLILLARADGRLILAPLYGAGLLAVSEVARTCQELRRVQYVGPAVIAARLTTAAASAGLGGCAAALVAVSVTAAPARSVSLSVAATVAVGVAYAGIVTIARRGQPGQADAEAAVTPQPRGDESDAPVT
jgi:hypothetical protein